MPKITYIEMTPTIITSLTASMIATSLKSFSFRACSAIGEKDGLYHLERALTGDVEVHKDDEAYRNRRLKNTQKHAENHFEKTRAPVLTCRVWVRYP